MPATPANTITPRRAIKNYQVRHLINLGYVALGQAPIDISWPRPSRMTVKIDNGRDLDWEVQLGSTLVTRALSAVGRTMPNALW